MQYFIFSTASGINSKFRNPNRYTTKDFQRKQKKEERIQRKEQRKQDRAQKKSEKKNAEIRAYAESGEDPLFSMWYDIAMLFDGFQQDEYPTKDQYERVMQGIDLAKKQGIADEMNSQLLMGIRIIFGFDRYDDTKDEEMWQVLQKWGLL